MEEEEEVWVPGLLSPATRTGGMCDPCRGLVTQPYPRAKAQASMVCLQVTGMLLQPSHLTAGSWERSAILERTKKTSL